MQCKGGGWRGKGYIRVRATARSGVEEEVERALVARHPAGQVLVLGALDVELGNAERRVGVDREEVGKGDALGARRVRRLEGVPEGARNVAMLEYASVLNVPSAETMPLAYYWPCVFTDRSGSTPH